MSKIFQAMNKARRERENTDASDRTLPAPIQFPIEAVVSRKQSPPIPDATLTPDLDWIAPVGELRVKEGEFGLPDPHLVSLLAPDSVASEHYRTLRHRVEQLKQEGKLHVVGVTSPTHGDGKTLTALNLAGSLAQQRDNRVLVIDADLRQPSVARYLGMRAVPPGMAEFAGSEHIDLQNALRRCRRYNLHLLAARSAATSSPYEILQSPSIDVLMEEIRHHFDYVVVDSPPMTYSDCRLLGKHVDGFLMVVGANRTPRMLIEEALDSLDSRKLVGIVYNADHRPVSGAYYYKSRSASNATAKKGLFQTWRS